jgi:curli biogenesis system outer membrane secretion channel CsgG
MIALTSLVPALQAQADTRPGIAVLPFNNGGSYGKDKEDFAALQQGIPAMLTTELSVNPAARLVDRDQISKILDEQKLAKDGSVDAATAAKVGKLVGAKYMIMGTFTDFYGKFRIDARIVSVETSEIIKVVRGDPKLEKREEAFRLIQSVAENLMKETSLPPLTQEQAKAAKARNVPTEALSYYSRALLWQDQGDKTKASEYFKKALDVFPEYSEAKEGLRKVS